MLEYKVVPAPSRTGKVKGLKTSAERFAHMLSGALNAEAHGGWRFVRTETLTCEERSALGRIKTSTQTVMIFARPLGGAAMSDDDWHAQNAAQPYAPQAYAEPVYEEPAYAPQQDYQGQAYAAQDYAEEEYREPARQAEPEPVRAPAAAAQPAPRGRQEPLFRAGAMLRAGGQTRVEPELSPRAGNPDDF